MKLKTSLLTIAVAVAVAGAYWLGRVSPSDARESTGPLASEAAAEPPLKSRRVLYYRNPMGLADTSPTPKKDPMGMDYIPVYDGDEEPAGGAQAVNQVRISTEKVQKLGVRTEPATLRPLGKTVRAAGRVEPDERRMYAISPKFEGYVERLHVNVTGQPVTKGQPLFEVYSPELVSAQREYAIAAQGVQAMKEAGGDALAGMTQLADSALLRLRNWDLSQEQIDALVRTGEVRRTVTFRSPVTGIVTQKKALQGMRFMPGEALYEVTDLSSVWVLADVFEQDIGLVKPGAKATVRINAYPERLFSGTITYVYPTLTAETRSVPVRIELANAGRLLKPAMFAQVELPVGGSTPVLTVPDSAVIDSGTRQLVLVDTGEGRFEPRDVRLGARGPTHVEIRDGVRKGEKVVVAANFLIDAESNLKAAVGGLGSHAGHGTSAAQSQPQAAQVGHKGQGTVDGIDAKDGTISLNHEPIASLGWPAMTMEFKVANAGLLQNVRPGAPVSFEFVERAQGEWVVTAIAAAKQPSGHAGR